MGGVVVAPVSGLSDLGRTLAKVLSTQQDNVGAIGTGPSLSIVVIGVSVRPSPPVGEDKVIILCDQYMCDQVER